MLSDEHIRLLKAMKGETGLSYTAIIRRGIQLAADEHDRNSAALKALAAAQRKQSDQSAA